MIVIGVDPGAGTTGYGVVARDSNGGVSLIECGVVRTDSATPLAIRLRQIHDGISEVLHRHTADAMAVEGVFFARNARSTVILGHARGAILLAAALRDLPVFEYAPAEVKNAVVGTGRATKDQVQFMVQRTLRLRTAPSPADAADAVAVALCHCTAGTIAARLAAAR